MALHHALYDTRWAEGTSCCRTPLTVHSGKACNTLDTVGSFHPAAGFYGASSILQPKEMPNAPLGTTPAPTELLPVHASRNVSRQAETPLFEARRDVLSHAEAQRVLTKCHEVLNPVVAKVLNSVWHFVMP